MDVIVGEAFELFQKTPPKVTLTLTLTLTATRAQPHAHNHMSQSVPSAQFVWRTATHGTSPW